MWNQECSCCMEIIHWILYFWVCWVLTSKRKNFFFFLPECTHLCRREGKTTLIVSKLMLKITQANLGFAMGMLMVIPQNPVIFLRFGCSTHPAHVVHWSHWTFDVSKTCYQRWSVAVDSPRQPHLHLIIKLWMYWNSIWNAVLKRTAIPISCATLTSQWESTLRYWRPVWCYMPFQPTFTTGTMATSLHITVLLLTWKICAGRTALYSSKAK